MKSQEIMNKVKAVEEFAESIGLPADVIFWDVDREATVDDIEQAVNDCYCYDGRSPVAMRLTPQLLFSHDIYVKAEPVGEDWCDKYKLVDPKPKGQCCGNCEHVKHAATILAKAKAGPQ